ncbi:MAG: sigma-70 family RNA polymerase sigma factor [Bacteroidaceae bacterium]|nr:sigma-70 family RNA polymerase sigma factor [Bacteroidaceae bacterium]
MIDKTILQRLFCQHYSEMIHLARTLLYDGEEAEDTVQDVFVRLMEADMLPSESKMRAYLMTAVHNGCVNRIRQKSVKEQAKNLYCTETETDMRYIEERLETLDAVCDYADSQLAEPHRTIFRLRFKEGLMLKEIALQLDMNLKTVFKYLSQSIQRVKEHFRP